MKKGWLKDVARDFIALGGIPFFVLVLVRVWILDAPAYLSQFLISGTLFFILAFVFKGSIYSGFSLIALFFTALVYSELRYTLFGSLVYLGLICSLFYLNYEKKKIILGIVFGVVSITIGYFLVKLIFS